MEETVSHINSWALSTPKLGLHKEMLSMVSKLAFSGGKFAPGPTFPVLG